MRARNVTVSYLCSLYREDVFPYIGWTGDLCDIDQNGCIDPGCPIGTNCTDIPAPGTGAICSDCPIGSELDGAKCSGNALVIRLVVHLTLFLLSTDIDECEANLENCSQICINEVPFFRCDCESGFRPKNQTQCIGMQLEQFHIRV